MPSNLPDRERLVMTLYYYEEMTMREIGLAMGVVESRVSQVHASAVVHLRAALQDLAARGAFDGRAGRGRRLAAASGPGDGRAGAASRRLQGRGFRSIRRDVWRRHSTGRD